MDDTTPAKKTTEEKIRMCISYLQKHGYQVIFPRFGKESVLVEKLVAGQREKMMQMGGASAATLMNSAEVAALIGVHPDTIKRWMDEGQFPKPLINSSPSKRARRHWRLCDVQAFVQGKTHSEVA
jgi:predicted DNA-binding transcriptional regulator AlpA